ncbi:MAG: hypothetical protein WCW52_09210 [Elusimicrobiales bacterium]
MARTKSIILAAGSLGFLGLNFLAAENVLIRWSKDVRSEFDQAQSMIADKAGNIYIAGASGDLERDPMIDKDALVLAKYDESGRKLWLKELGASTLAGTYGLASDPNGGLYLTGSAAAGLAGGINLSKYDADGNKLWDRQLNAISNEENRGAAADRAGNIYVAAGSEKKGGPAFLFKYDADGNPVWTRQLDESEELPKGLAADAEGGVFVAGNSGTPTPGRAAAFLGKYDTDGTRLWHRDLSSTGDTYGEDVAVDAGGEAYLTGHTNGSFAGQNTQGGFDIFTAKYDADGSQLWLRQGGSAGPDYAYSAAPDPEGGIFVSGISTIKDASGAERNEAFLIKYDADGTLIWNRRLGPAGAYAAYGVEAGQDSDTAGIKGYSAKGLWGDQGPAVAAVDNLNYASAPPALYWTGEPGYAKGAAPKAVSACDEAVFRVKYFSPEGYPPAPGYPRIRIKKGNYELPGSPFAMKTVSGTAAGGLIYSFSKLLEDGVYSYVFEALDKYAMAAAGSAARLHPGIIAVRPDASKHPLCVHPLLFSPKTGAKAGILFNIAKGTVIRVAVVDNAGKEIRELFRGDAAAGRVEWDGKGPGGEKLKPGIYDITLRGRGLKLRRKIFIK